MNSLCYHYRTPLGSVVIVLAKTARSRNPSLRVRTLQPAPVCTPRRRVGKWMCNTLHSFGTAVSGQIQGLAVLQFTLNRRLGRSQSRSGRIREKKDLPQRGIETRLLSYLARSLATVQAVLFLLVIDIST